MFAPATARVQHIVAERCALVLLPPSLTTLELSDLSPDFELTGTQVRDALSAAPGLQYLMVHEVSVFEVEGPRLALPVLSSFNFRCSSVPQAVFVNILDLPELCQLVLQVEGDKLFELVAESLNYGSKVVKLNLTISSTGLRFMRSFFRTMPELRWLRVADSDELLETTIGALVLSSPDVFQSMQRMEFGDNVDEELVLGIFRGLASVSSSVKVISPVSGVVNEHIKLRCLSMQDGDADKKYQWVVNGDYWDDVV
ncbi:hypothetical protein R3P38DRAFT_3169775 [Favolaschia claudopus]